MIEDDNEQFPITRNASTESSGRLSYLLQEGEEHFRIVLLAPTGEEYMRTLPLLIEDLVAIYGSLESWHDEAIGDD